MDATDRVKIDASVPSSDVGGAHAVRLDGNVTAPSWARWQEFALRILVNTDRGFDRS